jgi:NAD(P)H dehydrogenase (quinone)
MIVVTGASGQLGRHVIAELLKKLPASRIAAAVRNPAKAADLIDLGVNVRKGDYNDPGTLDAAFAQATAVLLISSNEFGQRAPQHRNVIDAARRAKVGFLAYTSVLHADASPMGLAIDHRETESMLAASGIPHAVLRNGWYTENYLASIPHALQTGMMFGCAGEGKVSSASRADYAAAAAAVLVNPDRHTGRIYELAGDEAYTLSDFAAALSRLSGKSVSYHNVSPAEFKGGLLGAGLPEPLAELLADSEIGVSKGALFNAGHQLSQLIGRPTIRLDAMIGHALANG